MFHDTIENIKNDLLRTNPAFGKNGYYYKDTIVFKNAGISDSYQYLFYIRPIIKGAKKYTYTQGDLLNSLKSNYRIVLQVPKDSPSPIAAIMSTLELGDHLIKGWNDDSEEVSQAETGKSVFPKFDLYSIDFEILLETVKKCSTICI